jgi:UDP-GlcNAc:undecaprenyl-phosphate/decaprenyl-phosphate GlcNAc-1-phosphate transferase
MISLTVFALFFIFCLFFSFIMNWLFLKFSKSLGVRNNDDLGQVRWASDAKPSLGGLSFFLIFLITVAASGFIPGGSEQLFQNQKILGILAATTLGFIIGLADDSYNTNPLVKFIGQLTCAFILIFANVYIEVTGNLAFDYLVTILWVVGLMNSINMLDNMDGITTTTSIVILIAAVFIAYSSSVPFPAVILLLIGVLGSLFGFLFFNWNPAKIYMGDTGSQFLGVFLAAISILLLWNVRDNVSGVIQIKQFVLPLLFFTVPLMDTLTVFMRRLLKKQSPFVGGKDHTTHQLVFFGFSEKQTAWILILLGLTSSGIGIALFTNLIDWTVYATVGAFVYFFLVFGIMQIVYNIGKKRRENA